MRLSLATSVALVTTSCLAANSRFKYFPLKTPEAGPCDLCTGPDGAIWGQTFLDNLIFRIDPNNGHLEEFTIPYTRAPILKLPTFGIPLLANRTAFACVIRPGEDGNIYAATGIRNQFARINPTTKKIAIFDTGNPLGNLEPFNDAWKGPKGMFFSQTTQNLMTLFNYKTHKFTNFTPPTPESGPLGTFLASDGAIWFCEFLADKIGRLNFTAGTFKEYPVPVTLTQPAVMRAETRGAKGERYLWFTGLVGNGMGRIDMDTGEVKDYPAAPLTFPTEDTVDSEGNVWYSTLNSDTLNKLNPKTGKTTRIVQPGTILPLPGGVPPDVDIAIHYGPKNRIWFTELLKNRVGSYQL